MTACNLDYPAKKKAYGALAGSGPADDPNLLPGSDLETEVAQNHLSCGPIFQVDLIEDNATLFRPLIPVHEKGLLLISALHAFLGHIKHLKYAVHIDHALLDISKAFDCP